MVRRPRDNGGGIAGLRELIGAHAEAVEADLARFYHVRLSDLCTGRLTWRRLRVLLRHLPLDAALHRVIQGDVAAWSANEHLLAGVLDTLRWANWQRAGGKGRQPRPIPRPGSDASQRMGRSSRSTSEVRAYLARFRPRREEVSDARRN